MKEKTSIVDGQLISKWKLCFLSHEFMDALGVVYPNIGHRRTLNPSLVNT